MFDFIDSWKVQWNMRKRRKRILKDIKEVKKVYLDYKENYMCLCFRRVDEDKYRRLEDIQQHIPEFNRADMNAEVWAFYNSQWWDIWNRESRIKAFDKLIEIYSK